MRLWWMWKFRVVSETDGFLPTMLSWIRHTADIPRWSWKFDLVASDGFSTSRWIKRRPPADSPGWISPIPNVKNRLDCEWVRSRSSTEFFVFSEANGAIWVDTIRVVSRHNKVDYEICLNTRVSVFSWFVFLCACFFREAKNTQYNATLIMSRRK